ncbi:MAG: hypothetical protein EBU90_17835 [Proteobacteria bacterium]|nr:hypothetical protein [Pseudomonadota bacterium]
MKYIKINCPKCDREIGKNNFSKHVDKCQGKKECPVCHKMFTGNAITCSHSCSNKHFRTGENNGNWKQDAYRSTCFNAHEKKCLICGEEKIVAVHHLNENHDDNRAENLIPLCPTHHQYVHSRYADDVLPIIKSYIENYKLRMA